MQKCILAAGMVWNREILSKHEENYFLDFGFPLFLWFLAVILIPELFRKLRETPGMHSHQVWSKSEISCTSYDKKTKTVCTAFCEGSQNTFKINKEHLNLVFLMLLAVILVPELFRKLRETPGMHSHQVSSIKKIASD